MKYRALARLLEVLAGPIADGLIRVGEGWRDNEQALGLELPDQPRLSAFVFTYGQAAGRYGLDLGFPDPADIALAGVPVVHEGLSLEQIAGLLEIHFDLPAHA